MKNEIVSKFNEKPKIKATWWSLWFGLGSLVSAPALGAFNRVMRQLLDPISVNPYNRGLSPGMSGVLIALILAISAIVISVKALKKGEHSWVVWVGFVIGILVCAFWTLLIIGEIVYSH